MNISFRVITRATIAALTVQWVLAAPMATANPYLQIAERNAFGLLPPPPPEKQGQPEPEPEPLPNVKVTGITTIMGIPRALVKVQYPAKPPKEPAREESYILVAGGTPQGGVQVLEISDSPDLDKVKVKVRQDGKESWLPLEKDTPGVAAAAKAPPPGANPAQVATAQAAAQRLAAARAAANRGQPAAAAIPTRNVRTPTAAGNPGYTPGTAGASVGTPSPNRNLVTRDYGLSREEQVILIEANREMTIEDVAAGNMPPLPPTEMTPPELDPSGPPPGDEVDEFLRDLPQ